MENRICNLNFVVTFFYAEIAIAIVTFVANQFQIFNRRQEDDLQRLQRHPRARTNRKNRNFEIRKSKKDCDYLSTVQSSKIDPDWYETAKSY